MFQKLVIALILSIGATSCAVNAQQDTRKNYTGSYEVGGCNSTPEWSCPQPKPLDEGLGGTGGGAG